MLDPTIYLFNPENDLALGIGTANYTPAPNVREFHAAGAMLPLWYSRGMSAMILGDTAHADWLSRKCGEFGFTAEVIGRCDREGGHCAVPWGWSANAVRQLTDAGVPRTALPSDRAIERMRTLSHRRSAAWLAAGLARSLDYPLPVVPVEASSVDEVMEFVVRHGGCFIKSPWSGSGRGVIDSTLIPAEQLRNTASGIIRRQGSVMVEERLDKVMDFAMLFHIDAAVSHVGYSVFFNETANAYGGNRIMSDIRIEEMIESQVGLGVMSRIT
ncbi:MAG: hypothetical protein K2M65_07575, partial [Muribaculaceae bacterium]|nr:hypothetical protein [Muribaculaceae bacterium]